MSDEPQENADTAPPADEGPPPEVRLLQHLALFDTEIKRSTRDAMHLRLSRLLPANRRPEKLQAATALFAPIAEEYDCQFFPLRSGDLFLVFDRRAKDDVTAAFAELRAMYINDPLVAYGDRSATGGVMEWFRLDRDMVRLERLVRAIIARPDGSTPDVSVTIATAVSARAAGPAAQAGPAWTSSPVTRTGAADGDGRPPAPMTPQSLHRIEVALARADLSNLVRRQTICGMNDPRGIPDPVFTEVFVSIGDLRQAIAPGTNLSSDPWLFQRLTATLDRRVLAMLARRDDRSLERGFSVNLNVGTILSEEFLRFDAEYSRGVAGNVILELRVEDICADLGAYAFARDFVHQRGYRICIDGMTVGMLPYVERRRLEADIIKLNWDPNMPALMDGPDGLLLEAMMEGGEAQRTVVARCDTEDAIGFGLQLGIGLFQGRYIDKRLAGRPINARGWHPPTD